MEGVYERQFEISPQAVDPQGKLKLSWLLYFVQEVAGDHSTLLGASREKLLEKGLFWAVLRHRAVIHRLPKAGETITVTTWPMPTTRSSYPRAAAAYDSQGQLLFQSVSLWVLMEVASRKMVLPGRSGVTVPGITQGPQMNFPGSLAVAETEHHLEKTVLDEDLDINGHMNNCRYLDWVAACAGAETPGEFTVCYLSEARLGEPITLGWRREGGEFRLEAVRKSTEKSAGHSRVFAAELRYESVLC